MNFEHLVKPLADRLIEKELMFVTAESCTGGWIAKACTDLAGSSVWFEGGVVSYSYALKTKLLGVSKRTLVKQGAVCEDVVKQMALGACEVVVDAKKLDKNKVMSVAVSGIAGPGGGSADKPVGTVWFAWAQGDTILKTEKVVFDGDRDAVRQQTVEYALKVLANLL